MKRRAKCILERVIDEIVIQGNQGTSIPELLELIDRYDGEPSASTVDDGSSEESPVGSNGRRALYEQIWHLLLAHDSVEGLDPFKSQAGPMISAVLDRFRGQDAGNGDITDGVDVGDLQSSLGSHSMSGTGKKASNLDDVISKARVKATNERLWIVVTGHPPNFSSVPKLKFELVALILKSGSAGILQPDLTTLSGQDKRSLPRRTTELAKAGYLVKRAINTRGMRTSLLIHKRYEIPQTSKPENAGSPQDGPGTDEPHEFDWSQLDRDVFIKSVMSLLKKHRLLQRDDFRERMGAKNNATRRRRLQKIVTHLLGIGCVAEVDAPSADSGSKLFRCLKFIRDPTAKELKVVVEGQFFQYGNSDKNQITEVSEEQLIKSFEWDITDWDRSRPIVNRISEIVSAYGLLGVDQQTLWKHIPVQWNPKPFDALIVRSCSYTPTAIQTHPFARQGITREIDCVGKSFYYKYYTEENYDQLVAAGERDWPQEIPTIGRATQHVQVNPLDPVANLDDFGFSPIPKALASQVEDTPLLKDLVKNVILKDEDLYHRADDIYGPEGHLFVSHQEPRVKKPGTGRGGRKYPAGEEPYRAEVRARWKAEGKEVPKYVPLSRMGKRGRGPKKKVSQPHKKRRLDDGGSIEAAQIDHVLPSIPLASLGPSADSGPLAGSALTPRTSRAMTRSRKSAADSLMVTEVPMPNAAVTTEQAGPIEAGVDMEVHSEHGTSPIQIATHQDQTATADKDGAPAQLQSEILPEITEPAESPQTIDMSNIDPDPDAMQLAIWHKQVPKNHLHAKKMDFLQLFVRCGYLFPGSREGAHIWKEARAKFHHTVPKAETRTLEKIMTSLVDGGIISEHRFTFEAKTGRMVDKAMFTLPQTSYLSKEAQGFRKKMIGVYPYTYIPPEVGLGVEKLSHIKTGTYLPEVKAAGPGDMVVYPQLPRKRKLIVRDKAGHHIVLDHSAASYQVLHPLSGTFGSNYTGLRYIPLSRSQTAASLYNIYKPRNMMQWIRSKRTGRTPLFYNKPDPPRTEFEWNLKVVEDWEMIPTEMELQANQFASSGEYSFIHHVIPRRRFRPAVRSSQEYEFVVDPLEDHTEINVDPVLQEDWDEESDSRLETTTISRSFAAGRPRKRPRVVRPPYRLNQEPCRQRAPRRVLLSNVVTRRLTEPQDHPEQVPVPDRFLGTANSAQLRWRARDHDSYFSSADERRLMIAITIVRTLLGGLDRAIDWGVVGRIFPKFPDYFLRRRYANARADLKKYKFSVLQGWGDFFLEAYEKGAVDAIDFDNVEQYDWNKLVDYTIAHMKLETYAAKHEDTKPIPETRDLFDQQYEIRSEEQAHEWRAKAFGRPSDSMVRRNVALNSLPYTVELERSEVAAHGVRETESGKSYKPDELARAEAVIQAAILTNKDDRKDEAAIKRIDELEPEGISLTALKSLVDKKVILRHRTYGHQDRASGLNYDFTAEMFVNISQELCDLDIEEASGFHKTLQTAFEQCQHPAQGAEEGDCVPLGKAIKNGEALLLLSLFAEDKISFVQKNLPVRTSDMTEARQGKRVLAARMQFDLAVKPRGKVFNPSLDDATAAPRQAPPPHDHLSDPARPIPSWYDLQGNLHWAVWSKFLICIISILTERSGATARSLSQICITSVPVHDAIRILSWLDMNGFARRLPHVGSATEPVNPALQGYELCGEWWRAVDEARKGRLEQLAQREAAGAVELNLDVEFKEMRAREERAMVTNQFGRKVSSKPGRKGRKSYAELLGGAGGRVKSVKVPKRRMRLGNQYLRTLR